ncbi:globin domain-containing protein [Crocinitomix algicola]|uniref:globin domain-containing protein n=1 Tax=Crocinitomix algicola TaxID=1740263 RepID=UPI0008724A69|nr:hypothetical protein [Crocinitomix algicola]
MEETKTLYELVGDERLLKILQAFYARVFKSEIIGPLFNQTNANEIIDKQYRFLTQFLGGPPRYNNKYGHPRMRMRHMPHKITQEAKEEWLKLMKESIWEVKDMNEELKTALYNCFPQVAQHMVNS